MPLAIVTMPSSAKTSVSVFPPQAKLFKIASKEIIPAGCYSKQGPLRFGDTIFNPHYVEEDDPGVDVLIEVRAQAYEDRIVNKDERAAEIRDAYMKLFPRFTFTVWLDLTEVGLASNSSDSNSSDFALSMDTAIRRAKAAMDEAYGNAGRHDEVDVQG